MLKKHLAYSSHYAIDVNWATDERILGPYAYVLLLVARVAVPIIAFVFLLCWEGENLCEFVSQIFSQFDHDLSQSAAILIFRRPS